MLINLKQKGTPKCRKMPNILFQDHTKHKIYAELNLFGAIKYFSFFTLMNERNSLRTFPISGHEYLHEKKFLPST